MAEINDITKLRPELANISLAELERKETELRMARASGMNTDLKSRSLAGVEVP